MVREAERIRYSRGYVVILEGFESDVRVTEKFNSLAEAERRYKYHYEYLRWSLSHKLGMGFPKEETNVTLTLWDNGEQFELAEEEVPV
jgi:hypothetical protein